MILTVGLVVCIGVKSSLRREPLQCKCAASPSDYDYHVADCDLPFAFSGESLTMKPQQLNSQRTGQPPASRQEQEAGSRQPLGLGSQQAAGRLRFLPNT